MPSLSIELSDALHARLVARASQCGSANVEQYVQSLLTADADVPTTDTDLDPLLQMTRRGPHRVNGANHSQGAMQSFLKELEQAGLGRAR